MATGSTGYLPAIDYTARDYATIRAALVTHVQNFFPNDWQDFTESNLGMCILELVAYVGDQLSFYLDRCVNEMFLPTVVQRANAINLVSLLGYVPRSTSAASASIRMTMGVAQSSTVTVPAYTPFTDNNGESWEFLENIEIPAGRIDTYQIAVTNEVAGLSDGSATYSLTLAHGNIVPASLTFRTTISSVPYNLTANLDGTFALPFGGTALVDYEAGTILLSYEPTNTPDVGSQLLVTAYQWNQPIIGYQGRTRLEQLTSTGTANQFFVLTNSPVLISPRVEDLEVTPNPNRFEVWIGDPADPFGNSTGTLWRRVDSLVSATALEEVYALTMDDQDRITITFGDNLNGKVPPAGTINVIYRTGGGSRGNVSTGFITTSVTGLVGLFSTTVSMTNYEPASGGAERESLDEMRINAPAYFRTNDTATTEQDYDALSLYSQAGLGAVTRAKSRLTPAAQLTTKTVHTAVELGTIPISTPVEYYLLIPATPVAFDTATPPQPILTVSFTISGIVRTATADDLGSGLATLLHATVAAGGVHDTRWRYDQQDYTDEIPTGYVGNGTQIDFTGSALVGFPVFPSSVVFSYRIGTTDYIGYDDGTGHLVGTNVWAEDSLIDYDTGDIELHFGDPAEQTSGNDETFNFNGIVGGADVYLDITINGANQVVRFQPADAVAYGAVTADEVVEVLNNGGFTGGANKLVAATAANVGGFIYINTDAIGATRTLKVNPYVPGPGGDANDNVNGLKFSLVSASGVSHPIANTSTIKVTYMSCLHLVLNFAPDAGTIIECSCETGPNIQDFPTNNVEVYTWSQDATGDYVPAGVALRDNLKSFLDLRRVLGTSVQVLPGQNLQIHYKLTTTFDPSISSTATSADMVAAIEEYFASIVNVNAGVDVPLAAIYDVLYPLSGVVSVIAQDVGVRMEIGEGDAATAVFLRDTDLPGHYIPSSRIPIVSGLLAIKVYVGSVLAGESDGATPHANISATIGAAYQVLGGSYVHVDTGDFQIKISPAPPLGTKVYLDFYLDEAAAADGMAIWNVEVEPWEIATVGEIYINDVKVN